MQFILAAFAMQMPYYHHLEKRCGVAGTNPTLQYGGKILAMPEQADCGRPEILSG
jgi:hypothetical protein